MDFSRWFRAISKHADGIVLVPVNDRSRRKLEAKFRHQSHDYRWRGQFFSSAFQGGDALMLGDQIMRSFKAFAMGEK